MTSDHAAVESEGLVLVLLDGLAVHYEGTCGGLGWNQVGRADSTPRRISERARNANCTFCLSW